jgi:hypothetical protein
MYISADSMAPMKGFIPMKNPAAVLLIAIFSAGYVIAQEGEPELPPLDESQFSDSAAEELPAANMQTGQQSESPSITQMPEIEASSGDAIVQNAVIEGVQISSEPGDVADEKVVSGYFIFRDKPSSFFYDVRLKEKKVVFEFNDTKTGSAPISSPTEPPITGFDVEQRKIDINKDVRGLKPEWHTQVKITFKMDQMPKITVNDEYNVISFSYKWSSDPKRLKRYIEGPGPNIALWSSATLGVLGTGVAAYLLFIKQPPDTAQTSITITDLPLHQQ